MTGGLATSVMPNVDLRPATDNLRNDDMRVALMAAFWGYPPFSFLDLLN